jgi:hypothetical protein
MIDGGFEADTQATLLSSLGTVSYRPVTWEEQHEQSSWQNMYMFALKTSQIGLTICFLYRIMFQWTAFAGLGARAARAAL